MPAADSEDPAELQRQIAELQRKLALAQAGQPSASARNTAVGQQAVAADEIRLLIQGSVFGDVHVGSGAKAAKARRILLAEYLRGVRATRRVARVDLLLSGHDHRLNLDAIYTELDTTSMDSPVEIERTGKKRGPDEEQRIISAATFAGQHRMAALHGAPGSGKSTFLEMVAVANAGAMLKDEQAGLALLGKDWSLPVLLPVFVTLRQFAATLVPGRGERPRRTAPSLWKFIESTLGDGLKGLAAPLRQHLHEEGGLFLLDGFDEVPETPGGDGGTLRDIVKVAVAQLAAEFPQARFLLTARTYAWRQQDWALQGFHAAELAGFDEAKQTAFIQRWFDYLPHVSPSFSRSAADAAAANLSLALEANAGVRELATRPLLLTLMASLCAMDGRLPRDRATLYERSVSLLLDKWQSPKELYAPGSGARTPLSMPVAEFLVTSREKVEAALAELAWEVHSSQGHQPGAADVSQGALLAALTRAARPHVPNPNLLAEYICDRAGILVHDGQQVYRFPHRSFQEYLASCALRCRDDFPQHAAHLVGTDPGRWREVYLLAMRGTNTRSTLWDVLEHTLDLPRHAPAYWTAILCAAQATEECGLEVDPGPTKRRHIDTLRQRLAELVSTGQLDAPERAIAGTILGRLGDPRPGTGLNDQGLPDVIGPDYWVEIPAGPFLYGEEKKRRILTAPFRMARYPVTVAQFDAFIADRGYEDQRWWPDEKIRQDAASRQKGLGGILGTPNHPRIAISWFEATAFCRWLSSRTGRSITLPTAEQWERAARGTEGREFPWGDSWTDTSPHLHANMEDSGIGTTSAVGLFPRGATPDGLCDLAGNIWEWCSPQYSADNPARVLRGGSLDNNLATMRASIRHLCVPVLRLTSIGFRVVWLTPF